MCLQENILNNTLIFKNWENATEDGVKEYAEKYSVYRGFVVTENFSAFTAAMRTLHKEQCLCGSSLGHKYNFSWLKQGKPSVSSYPARLLDREWLCFI